MTFHELQQRAIDTLAKALAGEAVEFNVLQAAISILAMPAPRQPEARP